MRLFDIGGSEDGAEVVHDRVVTIPNVITAVRLLALPVFVWLVLGAEELAWAFWTLGAIAATDWIDGYIARKFDQVSRIGQILDPLIDRVLLATAVVTLFAAGLVDWWILALVIGRDVVLFAGAFAVFRGIPPIAVTRTGKFATTCLYIGLPAFLLANHPWGGATVFAVIAWGYTIVGLATYYAAGVQYARSAARLRSAER